MSRQTVPLLDDIEATNLEAGDAPPAAPEPTYLDWCHTIGIQTTSLEIRSENGMRGVYATHDIAPGETVMHVPRERLMRSCNVADVLPGVRRLMDACPGLSEHEKLALSLLEIRRSGGEWKPYVDALPGSFAHLPAFRRPLARQWLQGSSALRVAESFYTTVRGEFRRLRRAMDADNRSSLRDYAWARSAVATRAFSLRVDGHSSSGLVPLVDMVNCVAPAVTTWNSESSGGFRLVAVRPIARGQEVTVWYGPWPNTFALGRCGYALETNAFDLARLDFQFPADHFVHFLAGRPAGQPHWFEVGPHYDHTDTTRVFNLLRVASQPDMPTGSRLCGSLSNTAIRTQPVDLPSERRVLDQLIDGCERALARYSDPIERDDALLAVHNAPSFEHFALVTRRGEKRILHTLLSMAQRVRALLDLAAAECQAALQAMADEDGPFAGYADELRRVIVRRPECHPCRI